MAYNVLEVGNGQAEAYRQKSQWASLLTLIAAVMVITLSAVSIGVFGYVYCYIEHHTGFINPGNFTKSMNIQFLQIPIPESSEASSNNTNEFILPSSIVARLLSIGQLLYDELGYPISIEENDLATSTEK